MMRSFVTALQIVMQSASSTASTSPQRVAYVPEEHVDFIWSADNWSIILLAIVVVILLTITLVLRRRRNKTTLPPAAR